MTYLTNNEVKAIVHLSGHQIRLFLGNSDPKDFNGDAKKAIEDFHRNPSEYSDERLLEKGADVEVAHQHNVRIELRSVQVDGAAQVVAKGIWGGAREEVIRILRKELARHAYPLRVRTAGSSSFEFNREGVDKALPLQYVMQHSKDVLKTTGYVKGTRIDALKEPIIIAADGDGTIYDGPSLTRLPLLMESPVYRPLLAFLRLGGVFMLVSGNDLTRSFKRIVEGLPKELYARVLIAANGGADLAFIDVHGKPNFILAYRHHALAADVRAPLLPVDIVYIGDDDTPNGNDRPAFNLLGPGRSVIVKSLDETKRYIEAWMHERKFDFT